MITCTWPGCGGKINPKTERCIMCARSSDLEYEQKVAQKQTKYVRVRDYGSQRDTPYHEDGRRHNKESRVYSVTDADWLLLSNAQIGEKYGISMCWVSHMRPEKFKLRRREY